MSNPAIRYHPRLKATPEAELEVLAAVYSFVMQSHANRKAAASGGFADNNRGGECDQSKASSGSWGPSATDLEKNSDKPRERRKEVNTE